MNRWISLLHDVPSLFALSQTFSSIFPLYNNHPSPRTLYPTSSLTFDAGAKFTAGGGMQVAPPKREKLKDIERILWVQRFIHRFKITSKCGRTFFVNNCSFCIKELDRRSGAWNVVNQIGVHRNSPISYSKKDLVPQYTKWSLFCVTIGLIISIHNFSPFFQCPLTSEANIVLSWIHITYIWKNIYICVHHYIFYQNI